VERFDGVVHAFFTVTADKAIAEARIAEQEVVAGAIRGPLHGIPVAVKDLIDTDGVRTTAGSSFFRNRIPTQDATVVRRLRLAGAISIGKTSMHEWACGVTGENAIGLPSANPYDLGRMAGGSSGGSAAAVAAGFCFATLGTDTGGSIRIPAALCGVVGLKPTYGRASLQGIIPLSWSLDHVGPITRSVADSAVVLRTIEGFDPADPSSAEAPSSAAAFNEPGVRGVRLALPDEAFFPDLDGEVRFAFLSAIEVLRAAGATVQPVSLPELDLFHRTQGIIDRCEAAAFHADRLRDEPERFGADVRKRLLETAHIDGTALATARRTQAELRRLLEISFEGYDAILTPTVSLAAPERSGADPVTLATRLTALTTPFTVTGLPAVSLPCGFTKAGLPIGLQVIARPWNDGTVLRVAAAYERLTGWHRRTPRIAT